MSDIDPIAYAVPVFVLAIAAEYLTLRNRSAYDVRDGRTSISMGIGSVVVGLPYKVMFFWLLTQLHTFRLFDIGTGVGAWVALFIAEDCCYYWSHRKNHEVRMLWAGHVNHHSSEAYNLTTALRQSWTQPFMMWVFWIPLPLLGFDPLMVMTIQSTNLVYQFFIHTETVGKLGPLEWVFNTPSHHRVHHAVNPRYLDRNHGGTLIVWDRLFGTFVAETADDPPRFGITKNIATHNLWTVAFHEWRALISDMGTAGSVGAALGYLLRAPGWRPDGTGTTSAQLRLQAATQPHAMDTPPHAVEGLQRPVDAEVLLP